MAAHLGFLRRFSPPDSGQTNGVRLTYQSSGRGENVLLVMGSRTSGRVWDMYQTPALAGAGYRATTFNNRGVPPSDAPPGMYSLADLVADTKGLIEALDLAPCRIIGTSLGALIAQKLAVSQPHLVRCAVLIATKSRSDAARRAQAAAENALLASGIRLPAAYESAKMVFERLSPATVNNDEEVSRWLDLFEFSRGATSPTDGQAGIQTDDDHREALRNVIAPCRVIAFSDDKITPPHLAAEVAEAIPDCDYVEISDCGHLGYLERPEVVNSAIIEFLQKY